MAIVFIEVHGVHRRVTGICAARIGGVAGVVEKPRIWRPMMKSEEYRADKGARGNVKIEDEIALAAAKHGEGESPSRQPARRRRYGRGRAWEAGVAQAARMRAWRLPCSRFGI